jgi:hypothetical protein
MFALNGVDGFADFGASASQAIAGLQTALVSLGKGIGDTTLSKIVVDGLMGPKTTAAVNRALTVHLGTGQAPANLRTGSLSQAMITSQAATITQLLEAEVKRRGFTVLATKIKKPAVKKASTSSTASAAAPASTAVTTYVPPAAAAAVSPVYRVPAAPASTDMNAIIKWSAIGVGVVVVGAVGYYLVSKRRSPAMAGLGALLPTTEVETLERLMDRSGGVSDIFETMEHIANEKADHVRSNWQDEQLAKRWEAFGRKMARMANTTKNFEAR